MTEINPEEDDLPGLSEYEYLQVLAVSSILHTGKFEYTFEPPATSNSSSITQTDKTNMPRRPDDFAALDAAFSLPENIEDQRMRELYEVIVARMRKEAADLPMNTVQQLLIERIAFNYIVMREKERGSQGGFQTTAVQKDFNTFWLSMTQEFNRMLAKSDAMNGSERKAMLREIQQLILTTVNQSVTDPSTRSNLLTRMATAFENVKI